ncbi:MAG TPA: C39 family peptidase [Pantanalinema sp.]
MSVARLGSYGQILQTLRQLLAAAPSQSRPGTPSTSASPSASPLGRDVFISSFSLPAAPKAPLSADPNTFFISQVLDSRWNPNATDGNTNCGPASLAMALKAVGLKPAGLVDATNSEAWIDRTRMAMEGDMDDFKLTSDDDVMRGALASGAQAEKVYGLAGVEAAIAQGKPVVLAGNPVAYAGRFAERQYAKFDGGHFILVTGIQGDKVSINDPQSRVGSLTISRAELSRYMAYQGWNVGVAVSK